MPTWQPQTNVVPTLPFPLQTKWKATLQDPGRLARFVHFVNSKEPDPNVVFVRDREQIRPARTDEKTGPALEEAGVEMEVV